MFCLWPIFDEFHICFSSSLTTRKQSCLLSSQLLLISMQLARNDCFLGLLILLNEPLYRVFYKFVSTGMLSKVPTSVKFSCFSLPRNPETYAPLLIPVTCLYFPWLNYISFSQIAKTWQPLTNRTKFLLSLLNTNATDSFALEQSL